MAAPRCEIHPVLSAKYVCLGCGERLCKLCLKQRPEGMRCPECGGETALAEEAGAVVATARALDAHAAAHAPTPPPSPFGPRNRKATAVVPVSPVQAAAPLPAPEFEVVEPAQPPQNDAPPAEPPAYGPGYLKALQGKATPEETPEGYYPGVAAQQSVPAEAASRVPVLAADRKPPYHCKNHPGEMSDFYCSRCVLDLCSGCVKMVEGEAHCTGCGAIMTPILPEEQGLPPKSAVTIVAESFAYPFNGWGLGMLILGTLFAWGLSFIPMGAFLGIGFLYVYGIRICRTSAIGRRSPPNWPDAGDFGELWHLVVCWLAAFLPAIIWVFVALNLTARSAEMSAPEFDEETASPYAEYAGPEWDGASEDEAVAAALMGDPEADPRVVRAQIRAQRDARLNAQSSSAALPLMAMGLSFVVLLILIVLGHIYYPMALLGLLLFRSWDALHPRFVFGSMAKVPGPYLLACAILILSFFAKASLSLFTAIPLVGGLFLQGIEFFFLMVCMRALGDMYYRNQKKLGWFTRPGST